MSEIISIVILETDGGRGLSSALQSIKAQTFSSYEIYFLKNPDVSLSQESLDRAVAEQCSYTLWEPKQRLLPGELYSYAFKQVSTPYVLFMKEKDSLEPQFLQECMLKFPQYRAEYTSQKEAEKYADQTAAETVNGNQTENAERKLNESRTENAEKNGDEKFVSVEMVCGKYFCQNPLVSEKPQEHILSSRYIKKFSEKDIPEPKTESERIFFSEEDQHLENSNRKGDSKNRYKETRSHDMGPYIRNVTERPAAILLDPFGCIFTTQSARQVRMPANLSLQEDADAAFILNYLLKYPTYAVAPKAKYYYFEPKMDDFLYHVNAHQEAWYEVSLENFLLPLLYRVKREKGKIPEFLQNYCMLYIDARFMANQDNRDKKILLGDRLDRYLLLVKKLFMLLDESVLLNQKRLVYLTKNPEMRCMYLRIKYGISNVHYRYVQTPMPKKDRKELGDTDLVMMFRDCVISRLSQHRVSINIMNYYDGDLCIDGSLISIFQYADIRFYAVFNGKRYPITDTTGYSQTKYFGVAGYRRIPFFLRFHLNPKKKLQRITFFARYEGKNYPMKMTFANHWAKLTKSPRYSYWRFNQYLCHHAMNGISIKKANLWNVSKRELQYMLQLYRKKDKKYFKFRLLYWITRPYFKRKKIWLMLDKLYKGGDSAEYLYRYCAKKPDGITKYYLINEDTSDYRKLKKDGYRPLKNGSLLHKLVFVNADLVLITNSHLFPFNGYTKEESKYIRGLCNFTSMCLQHGLSVQQCAIAQRRIIDNTSMYFLGSRYEKENLSRHAYDYARFDILKLTGIARYDGLINHDKKQILISPTWRMYNSLPVTTSEGEQRGYNPAFKETTYFKIYNALINNEKLIRAAKTYGYKIKYLLHPIISSQLEDFTPNPELEVIPSVGDLSYEQILTQSSLMVTDYSGVQFDFAYMRKPVVYFHPEELPPHYQDGCFFYDTMGFGEICTKTDQLVDLLCEYMKHGCQMKSEYRRRADDFFAYRDHHNCERIYQEILQYQKIIDQDKLRTSVSK